MMRLYVNSIQRFNKSTIQQLLISLHDKNGTDMTTDQLEFSTFCIGNVAEALNVSEPEAYDKLRESGLLNDYIVKSYDILHTYSRRYITEELVELLKNRGFA